MKRCGLFCNVWSRSALKHSESEWKNILTDRVLNVSWKSSCIRAEGYKARDLRAVIRWAAIRSANPSVTQPSVETVSQRERAKHERAQHALNMTRHNPELWPWSDLIRCSLSVQIHTNKRIHTNDQIPFVRLIKSRVCKSVIYQKSVRRCRRFQSGLFQRESFRQSKSVCHWNPIRGIHSTVTYTCFNADV